MDVGEVHVVSKFECYRTGKTFIARAVVYNDGMNHYDVKCEECPYCGRDHWNHTTGPIGT